MLIKKILKIFFDKIFFEFFYFPLPPPPSIFSSRNIFRKYLSILVGEIPVVVCQEEKKLHKALHEALIKLKDNMCDSINAKSV